MFMKTKSKFATVALAAFSVWVPLVGIVLWFMCKKGNDTKSAKLFITCAAIGFVINLIPRLMGVM